MRTASRGDGSSSWSSTSYSTPRKMTFDDDNVFSFREARVQEYLSSLSEAESSSSRDSFTKAKVPRLIPVNQTHISYALYFRVCCRRATRIN